KQGKAKEAKEGEKLAAGCFRRVLNARPGDAGTAADLAALLWQSGEVLHWQALARRGREEEGDSVAGSWAALGAAHAFQGEWSSAREALRKVASSAAHDDLLLALVCGRLGLGGEAAEACSRGLLRLPEKLAAGGALDLLAGLAVEALAGEREGSS